jgi:hypothetical protein
MSIREDDLISDLTDEIKELKEKLFEVRNEKLTLQTRLDDAYLRITQLHNDKKELESKIVPDGWIALPITDYFIGSTGEEIEVGEPNTKLQVALQLRTFKQTLDTDEQWSVFATIDHDALCTLTK